MKQVPRHILDYATGERRLDPPKIDEQVTASAWSEIMSGLIEFVVNVAVEILGGLF